MKYRVVFNPIALANIETLRGWLHEGAPTASRKWMEGLIGSIFSLDEMPYRCPIVPTKNLPKDVRCMVYKPYKIFYRVEEDRVIILHIRHTSRKPV